MTTKSKFESMIQNLLAPWPHWASVFFSINCDNICPTGNLQEFSKLMSTKALVKPLTQCSVNSTLPHFISSWYGLYTDQFPRTELPFAGRPPYVKSVLWTKARFFPWRRPERIWPHSHIYTSWQGGLDASRIFFTNSVKSAETSKACLCLMKRLSKSKFMNSEKRTT